MTDSDNDLPACGDENAFNQRPAGAASDVHALSAALARLRNVILSTQPPHQLQVSINRVLCILRKQPFRIFASTPPGDMPLSDFLASPQGRAVKSAMQSISTIQRVQCLKEDPTTAERVSAVWPELHEWLDWLSPLCPVMTYDDSLYARVKATDFVLSTIHAILSLPTSRLQWDIFFNPARSLLRLALDIYVRLADVYAFALFMTHPHAAGTCAGLFPIVLSRATDEGLKDEVAAVILAALHNRPRRLFKMAGRYIEVIDPHTQFASQQLQLHLMGALCRMPAMEVHRFPRVVVTSVVGIVRAFVGRPSPQSSSIAGPSPDVFPVHVAYEILGLFCKYDKHAAMIALEEGLASLMNQDLKHTRENDMAVLVQCLACTLVYPRALDRVNDQLRGSGVPPDSDLYALANFAQQYDDIRVTLAAQWATAARCADVKCSSPSDASLHACPCATALYCSKACQRSHWKAGGHRKLCPRARERREPLSPRGLYFLGLIVRDHILDVLPNILAHMKNESASSVAIVMDFAHATPESTMYRVTEAADSDPRIEVYTVHFYFSRQTIIFRPAGAPTPRFRLLTEFSLGRFVILLLVTMGFLMKHPVSEDIQSYLVEPASIRQSLVLARLIENDACQTRLQTCSIQSDQHAVNACSFLPSRASWLRMDWDPAPVVPPRFRADKPSAYTPGLAPAPGELSPGPEDPSPTMETQQNEQSSQVSTDGASVVDENMDVQYTDVSMHASSESSTRHTHHQTSPYLESENGAVKSEETNDPYIESTPLKMRDQSSATIKREATPREYEYHDSETNSSRPKRTSSGQTSLQGLDMPALLDAIAALTVNLQAFNEHLRLVPDVIAEFRQSSAIMAMLTAELSNVISEAPLTCKESIKATLTSAPYTERGAIRGNSALRTHPSSTPPDASPPCPPQLRSLLLLIPPIERTDVPPQLSSPLPLLTSSPSESKAQQRDLPIDRRRAIPATKAGSKRNPCKENGADERGESQMLPCSPRYLRGNSPNCPESSSNAQRKLPELS
ncbi:uncharacterized protein SCHCODRAFT_01194455 [Schizophyllum commune H4-8]|nr:uncharacterized protein SCHCODRAFT_01194455 [Schizophyllum commune H4-8]KAI5891872.1 hypothetical protein SCHCODRAFT_01194455 [Schizophyllum commune H4-8]